MFNHGMLSATTKLVVLFRSHETTRMRRMDVQHKRNFIIFHNFIQHSSVDRLARLRTVFVKLTFFDSCWFDIFNLYIFT